MKLTLLLICLPAVALASEFVFQFKSPAFNGIGYSAHQLNKEQISFNRRKSIADELKSIALQSRLTEDRSAFNTFISNLQSRIYSELAKQVTEQLFADDGNESGTFTLDDNTISWYKSADNQIYLTVTDIISGKITEIIIPVGTLFIPPVVPAETTETE